MIEKLLLSLFLASVLLFLTTKPLAAAENASHFTVANFDDPHQKKVPAWKMKVVQWARNHDGKKTGNQKAMAVGLAMALGPFGVHRLYLGTEPRVPVFYALSLGGGLGLLPICDIVAIVASRDLEQFKDSQKFVMWGK